MIGKLKVKIQCSPQAMWRSFERQMMSNELASNQHDPWATYLVQA